LARILNPRIALITNIGSAHIGILGSRQAIAEEKKKFFSEFDGSNTAMIPMDDDFRDFLAKDVSGKIVFYRGSSLPPFGGARDLGLLGTEIIWDGVPVRFSLPGKFNLNNALTAAALAMELNLSSSSIRGGFESVKPIFGRMEIFRGRVTLVRDCYNANPEGVEAALDFFDPIEWQGRKVFVMGSMLEMGAQSDEVHTILGKRLASCKGDMFFLYGEEMRAAADILKAEKIPFLHTQDMGELSAALDAYLKKGDLVLLKGSRAYAMEELTGVITGPGAEHVS